VRLYFWGKVTCLWFQQLFRWFFLLKNLYHQRTLKALNRCYWYFLRCWYCQRYLGPYSKASEIIYLGLFYTYCMIWMALLGWMLVAVLRHLHGMLDCLLYHHNSFFFLFVVIWHHQPLKAVYWFLFPWSLRIRCLWLIDYGPSPFIPLLYFIIGWSLLNGVFLAFHNFNLKWGWNLIIYTFFSSFILFRFRLILWFITNNA
jgi:hypothetical protein